MKTRRQFLGSGVALGATLATPGLLRAQGTTDLDLTAVYWPDEQTLPMYEFFESKHPGIKIVPERLPFSQLIPTLEVRLQARTATPDVFFVDGPLTASYTVRGHLEPIAPIFGGDVSRFTKAALRQGTWQGELMSLPLMSSSMLMFVNVDLFKEAGLEIPTTEIASRWTWAQTLEAAKKLTNAEKGIWGLTFEMADRPFQALSFAQSNGAQVISDDGLTATGYINSPEAVEAYKFYQSLYQSEGVSPPGSFDSGLNPEVFGTGRSAIFIATTQAMSIFKKYPDLNWAAAPMPYFEGGTPVTPTGSWHMGLNPRSEKKDAALEYIRAIAEVDYDTRMFGLRPSPPVLNASWDALSTELGTPAWEIVKYEVNNTAIPRPATPGYREYESVLNLAFREIQGGADVQQRLDTAARDIDRELDKYR